MRVCVCVFLYSEILFLSAFIALKLLDIRNWGIFCGAYLHQG